MISHRHAIAVVTLALVAGTAAARADEKAVTSGLTGLRKTIAVVDFEDKSDRHAWWWSGPHPGKGMTDMITTALVKSGRFRVIERAQLEHVIAEQQLGQSGIVTPQTAAQVGKVLGVSAIVYGAVTEFGYKKEETGGSISKIPLGGSYKKAEARVACDVRIIDTSTAEILAAESYSENESKRGVGIDTRQFSFDHDSKFDETLVGKATRKVIDKIVDELAAATRSAPWRGRVVKVEGGSVYLNAGSDAGITAGMTFAVLRKGEELVDPETGQSLGAEESEAGTIEVVTVKEKFAICKTVSGSGFVAGDIVRQP
jgi:curli biogenesis system outer membrane secretion channel CsgG